MLYKLDDLANAVNKLTINNAEYYESITETMSDAQGDFIRNMETDTHTSKRNRNNYSQQQQEF